MKNYKLLLGICALIVLLVGCSNTNTSKIKLNKKETKYYVCENGKKTYYIDYKFMKNIFEFDSILKSTVKSLNEIKDGKRDLKFISEIESEELKKDDKHKSFIKNNPGESELKTISSDINNYTITGLQYDKDKGLIEVFIHIETNDKQKDGLVKVINNQTYIYKIENNRLFLMQYDLSQYLH